VVTFKGSSKSKLKEGASASFKSDSKSLSSNLEAETTLQHYSPSNRVHKKLLIEDQRPVGYENLDYLIVREIKRGN
jgi:hypothetical protein